MIQVVYESKAPQTFSREELAKLVEEAYASAARNGLTGLLIYRNGVFLHVIEGERDQVAAGLDRISRDPRHSEVWRLAEIEVEGRSYIRWNTGISDEMLPIAASAPMRNLRHVHSAAKATCRRQRGRENAYAARIVRSFLKDVDPPCPA